MPRISQLSSLTIPEGSDEIAIVDTSAGVTKKITRSDLLKGADLPNDTVTTNAIADGAVTADKRSGGFYAGNHTLSAGVNSVSGFGFRPQYVRFTANRMGTGSGDSFSFWSYGVAYDNGGSIVQKNFVSIANTSSHATRRNENNALVGITTSNSAAFVGSVTAFNSDGVTIDVTTFGSDYPSWFIEAFA